MSNWLYDNVLSPAKEKASKWFYDGQQAFTDSIGQRISERYAPTAHDHPLKLLYQAAIHHKHQTQLERYLNEVSKDLKDRLFEQIFLNSSDPHKGGPGWGENHVFDSHETLAKAISSLAERILYNDLNPDQQNRVYGEIYHIATEPKGGDEWGKIHACDDTPRLLTALNNLKFISAPGRDLAAFDEWSGQKAERFELIAKDDNYAGRIGFINGINHDRKKAEAQAEKIAETVAQNKRLYCVHNPKIGVLGDILKALVHHAGYDLASDRLLREEWDAFFQNNPVGNFLQLCHSEGANCVLRALEGYDEELRQRILVIAIAPAAFIPKELCKRTLHLVNSADMIPNHLAIKRERLNDKADPDIIIFKSNLKQAEAHKPLEPMCRDRLSKLIECYLKTNDIPY